MSRILIVMLIYHRHKPIDRVYIELVFVRNKYAYNAVATISVV
jgi:hypothetical protein